MPLDPPDNDEATSRHRFYSALASSLDNNTQAMVAIKDQLSEIANKHYAVANEFHELKTTIKTAGRIATVLVALFGTAGGMVLKSAWDITDRVAKLEKDAEVFQVRFRPHEALPEKVQGIVNRVEYMEERIREYHPRQPKD